MITKFQFQVFFARKIPPGYIDLKDIVFKEKSIARFWKKKFIVGDIWW